MANPVPYVQDYNFSAYQATNPDRPLPADHIDAQFEMIENASGAVVTALEDIRRSDGKLVNGIVGIEALDPTILDTLTGGTTAAAAAAAASAAASAASAVQSGIYAGNSAASAVLADAARARAESISYFASAEDWGFQDNTITDSQDWGFET